MRPGRRAFVPLLLLCAAMAGPAGEPREFVQAVEFPYYQRPRQLWERDLVALKNIGVRAVESVSYTHLDVYKRQLLMNEAWGHF